MVASDLCDRVWFVDRIIDKPKAGKWKYENDKRRRKEEVGVVGDKSLELFWQTKRDYKWLILPLHNITQLSQMHWNHINSNFSHKIMVWWRKKKRPKTR